jgi:hypothetical protein
MVKVPSAPNAAFRRSEKFRVHLLLVLGIAFLGTAVTIIGLAGCSPATVAIGAGAIAAAGLISIFFALGGLRLTRKTDEDMRASVAHDTHTDEQDANWPPKTSRRFSAS